MHVDAKHRLVFSVAAVLVLQLALAMQSWSAASAAEAWEGIWTIQSPDKDAARYVNSCRIGEDRTFFVKGPRADMDKEALSKWNKKNFMGQIYGFEWGCDIEKITNVLRMDAWIFDLSCGASAATYSVRGILMKTDKPGGHAWYERNTLEGDNSALVMLYRCPNE
jgi:hypothetical protein